MILDELETLLRERRRERPANSYSAALFNDPERIARKISEEAFEVCLELGRTARSEARIAEEAADLVFHLLVGLVEADVGLAPVLAVLESRRR
jgi:phosphoribosyl-ATP pyrophosphohydrolase